MADHELKSFEGGAIPVHSVIDQNHDTIKSQDRYELARTGKAQVLKRNFGLMSMLGFSCTLLATWEGQLIGFILGYTNGGPAGLVYGFLVVWFGTTSIFIVLSELASMAPTAGGQYHWTYILAPRSYQKLLSYITGWLTVAGWQAGVVSGAYLTANIIEGLVILNRPTYVPKDYHATLILWGVILVAVFVNTVISRHLPKIEGVILILHVVGFFAILIPLVTLSPQNSASEVFTTFQNLGGWDSMGLSFFVGLTGTVFAFLGSDGVIHMSEEVENASVNVPRAIIAGVTINGILGFGMLITVLFCIGTAEDISEEFIYPFIAMFMRATGSVAGSSIMTALIILLALCTTIGVLASSSRMTWSFARDRGLPGWSTLSKVDAKSSIPLMAIIATTVISMILGLIAIGSATALNDLLSLSINAWYASYLVPSALLLIHRIRGTIQLPMEMTSTSEVVLDVDMLTWGPWRLPGILGIINNIIAVMFMIVIFIFSFFPIATPVTAVTMNYNILIVSAVAMISGSYYFVWGRHTYSGPVVEIATTR